MGREGVISANAAAVALLFVVVECSPLFATIINSCTVGVSALIPRI